MVLSDRQFYVYLITNKPNGTLYTGMTNDLMRRILEHKNKINEGFWKRYGLDKLVYYEIFKKPLEAITREKRIKKWKRQWKIELIEFMNPDWKDLAEDWYWFLLSQEWPKAFVGMTKGFRRNYLQSLRTWCGV